MCGLPGELQKAAETAAAALRPVAARLASRKIACRLRIETAQLMARAQSQMSPANWTSPPGDLFDALIEQTVDTLSRSSRVPSENVRWRASCIFVGLNRAWANAAREWRRHERTALLWDAHDTSLRVVARDAPVLERLWMKSAYMDRLWLRDGTLQLLAAGCPRLTELELADPVVPEGGALLEVVQALPLRRLDINGIRCVESGGVAHEEMTLHERARATLQYCLALLQEAPRLERLQVVVCDVCSADPAHNGVAFLNDALAAAGDRLELMSCGCEWCESFLSRRKRAPAIDAAAEGGETTH